MEDMLEHSVGIKFLMTSGKSVLMFISLFVIEPVYDFAVAKIDTYAMLSPYTKDLLGDIKIIILLITAFFVCIKVLIGLIKMIRDFNKK